MIGRTAAIRAVAAALLTFPLAGCTAANSRIQIRMETLEAGAESKLTHAQRGFVLDEARLEPVTKQINERVALIEVRNAEQWQTLSKCCSELGPQPDFSVGVYIAVVTRIGRPVDGAWPCCVNGVRVVSGAGLVNATLHAGTYLPDGTTCFEGAFVYGLRRTLVVDVNGDRFILN